MSDREQGMKVRREVLGDDHVDRAVANTTPFTEPFQDFITRYAWGEIWARPGLDRKTRSCITLAECSVPSTMQSTAHFWPPVNDVGSRLAAAMEAIRIRPARPAYPQRCERGHPIRVRDKEPGHFPAQPPATSGP